VIRFVYLSGSDRRLVIEAALLLGAARLGLWLLPFRVVSRLLDKVQRAHVGVAAPARRIAWAIDAAARYIPAATCLPRALAARALLARHGHAAQLRIGVARVPVSQSAESRRGGEEARRRDDESAGFASSCHLVILSSGHRVITSSNALAAHAWVECDGAILIGGLADLARYTPLSTHKEA
jgi:hypothetical protein